MPSNTCSNVIRLASSRASSRERTTRVLAIVAAIVTTAVILPVAALAAPTTYEFTSGSATIRGSLEGQSTSIFQGSSVITTPLTGISAVVDDTVGDYGRLESLSMVGGDFSIDLDQGQVSLDTLNVFSPTISSLTGSNLNAFGQFDLQTQINAVVTGNYPDGTPFGPASIQSNDGSGTAAGMIAMSGDQVLIQVIGVTVATFDQIGSLDPNAPRIEIKADFTFIGTAITNPIPEPSAALLFGLGVTLSGVAVRRKQTEA